MRLLLAIKQSYKDISASFSNVELAGLLGWNDVANRYRRSWLGAFWLTASMGILIGALSLIFGALFDIPMEEYLPFICIGLIVWAYVSDSISEGCLAFIDSSHIILQIRVPLFTHIIRVLWRNIIIFAHNILIFPLVMLFFWTAPSTTMPVALLGFIVLTINLLWMILVSALFCARYRDMIRIVQNIMKVLFYATPIMWLPSTLRGKIIGEWLEFNPFYHLVEIVRSPLLGKLPSMESWAFSSGVAIVGWIFTLYMFGRYQRRIPYWL